MIIYNDSKKLILATNSKIADTFFSRMVGLLNRDKLSENEGLVITHCNSIHMFFMKFAIDVIFIDSSKKVVGLARNIKPNCLSKIYWKASSAIELPVGVILQSKTEIGDKIILKDTH